MDGDQKFLFASLAVLSIAALVTLSFTQSGGVRANPITTNITDSTLMLASASTSKALTIVFQATQPAQVFNMALVSGKAKGTFLLSNSKVQINMGASAVKSITLNLRTSGIKVNISIVNSAQVPAADASPAGHV